jgi:hypothetical protein
LVGEDWLPHFNTALYEGDWSGVSLRAVGGRVKQLYPDPAATEPYADTEVLARCPNIRQAVARLDCDKNAVRLLRLGPGAHVGEHRDYRLGYADGEVRLHVPVSTSVGAEFVLDGSPIDMQPGDCWYVDVNRPHRIANHGTFPRIHLVVDCMINDWVEATFREALHEGASSG